MCQNSGTNGYVLLTSVFFFFQAEDGIRDLVRSRGLGDVYKRQVGRLSKFLRERPLENDTLFLFMTDNGTSSGAPVSVSYTHLTLPTSDLV